MADILDMIASGIMLSFIYLPFAYLLSLWEIPLVMVQRGFIVVVITSIASVIIINAIFGK